MQQQCEKAAQHEHNLDRQPNQHLKHNIQFLHVSNTFAPAFDQQNIETYLVLWKGTLHTDYPVGLLIQGI